MKSLTVAGPLAAVLAGMAFALIINHQIQAENEAANSDIKEITNRMKAQIKELDERNQGNPDYPR